MSLIVPSSIAGPTETKCIPRLMLFTNLPLCMKIVIYIFTLRSVIKPNKSDLLAASETVVISTVYYELQNALD